METELPDLHDLRAFCSVVDLQSVSKAAKLLGETKGSVSKRLLRLERVLGVSLLRRSPRALQITEEGAAYRNRAGRILEALEEAREELEQVQSEPRGRLRITAPVDLASSLLAPLIVRFMEKHPQIHVEMLATEQVLDFDAHQIDVALRPGVVLPDSSLIAHPLIALDAWCVAAPSYLRKHGEPKEREELSSHRVLMFAPQRRLLPELQAVLLANEASFVVAATIAGGGIALLPRLLIDREVREGELVRILADKLPEMLVTLYFLYRSSQFIPAKIRAFRAFLEAEMKHCEGKEPGRLKRRVR